MRILVVEDSLPLAEAMAEALTHDGHAVWYTGDARCALQWVREGHFDCATLDFRLGNKDTAASADLLTKRSFPFFFATGSDRTELPSRFGCHQLLKKPFTVEALLALVRRVGSH